MHISPTIQMQVIATHTVILELMNLLHGNTFSPWEDFFVNPFSSDVISPNQLCKCTCTYNCTGAGPNTCSGTMNLNKFFLRGSIIVSLTLYF